MQVIESLLTGRFGVALRLPSRWNVRRDADECAELVDESKGVSWLFFLFPGLHLDLREEHRGNLRRSLEHYARSMFDDVFRQVGHADTQRPPRTADPTWSPLVDVEHLSVGGAPALRTVHRIAYEPAREIMMGHLLIPLRRGLFEARVLCADQLTGYRESLLIDERLRGQGLNSKQDLEQLGATVRQADFDDPRRDDAFPEHSLSRARAAIRWLLVEANLRVTEPPSPLERCEVELPQLDCALVPPPRFAYDSTSGSSQGGCFSRVSFCGTDGVEGLRVQRCDGLEPESAADFPAVAEAFARKLHEASGVQDIRATVEVLPPLDQRLQALVIVEGTGHLGSLRNAMIFFHDQQRRTWLLGRFGTAAVPRDELVAELIETAQSFRLVRLSKQQKPWWRPW